MSEVKEAGEGTGVDKDAGDSMDITADGDGDKPEGAEEGVDDNINNADKDAALS